MFFVDCALFDMAAQNEWANEDELEKRERHGSMRREGRGVRALKERELPECVAEAAMTEKREQTPRTH